MAKTLNVDIKLSADENVSAEAYWKDYEHSVLCSNCKAPFYKDLNRAWLWNYCPKCGKKMFRKS